MKKSLFSVFLVGEGGEHWTSEQQDGRRLSVNTPESKTLMRHRQFSALYGCANLTKRTPPVYRDILRLRPKHCRSQRSGGRAARRGLGTGQLRHKQLMGLRLALKLISSPNHDQVR